MALTLDERLSEAEAALHALATGQAAVEVRDSDGSSIRYSQGNMGRLEKYIANLKSLIAARDTGTTAPTGPMRLVF